jgi:hypothetical protein
MDETAARAVFARLGDGPEPAWRPDVESIVRAGRVARRRREAGTVLGGTLGVLVFAGTFVIMPLWRTGPPEQVTPAQPSSGATGGKKTPDPAQAYARCAKEVRTTVLERGGPAIGGLRGRVATITGKGATVVVSDGRWAFACNVKPDLAVSAPGTVPVRTPQPKDFAVADNATGNVRRGDPGEMVWGGGALPRDVTSVTFVFPDKHRETALTGGGFWVMQYFARAPFTKPNQSVDQIRPITVQLDGPAGRRTLTLPWGQGTCNQGTHGC